jgi:hypothetical protein
MKLLKTLGLALCLAFLFTPLLSKAQVLDPTQVYTTGNIVQTTPQGGPTPWVNGVYQNNLTCWSGGDPGYCGPNPIVRPGDYINFSYGSTYLYQQQLVSSLLPSATGLQVNGYNFGFTAKNGNGWDDGRTDSLIALVRFWDNTGGRGANNLLYGNVYDLNSKFNWTPFNYSETFTKPLAVPNIGQVQYGFIGRDNNYWQGPYGPEIMGVNFSLKYSVDPCATNPLYSPTCSGYLDALAKLVPKTTVVGSATETTPTGTIAIIDNVAITPTGTYGGAPPPPPGSPPPPQGNPSPPGSPPPPEGSQPPQQQQAGPAGPMPPGPPMPGPTQQASASQPSANNPQAKVGEVNDSAGSSKTSSPVSLSSVLSMISSNQDKTSALEKSVVQAADAQAFSAGETAKQNAEKLAGDVQSQSIANSGGSSQTGTSISSGTQSVTQLQGSSVSMQGNQQGNSASNSARLQQSINSGNISIQSDTLNSNVTPQQQQYNIQNTTRQEFNVALVTPQVSYSLVAPTRYAPVQIELPTTEGIKFGYKGPVDNAMESKSFLPQMNNGSEQNASVKKNVQNNEAAGNVTIESIAKQPANYAQYFTVIPDVAFYAPKEIYKNQKTVDNARTLRGLQGGSDKLHQEMINQQYK